LASAAASAGFRSVYIGFRCSFNIQQFYVEYQGRVCRNARDTRFAVSQFWWDNQFDLAAFLDVFQAFGPARDNAIKTERKWLTTAI
jgi:hypothetical protein